MTFYKRIVCTLLLMFVFLNPSYSKNDKPVLLTEENSDLDGIKKLLKAGVKLSANNESGSMALLRATFLNRKDLVKALLEGGADGNIRDGFGETPLIVAVTTRSDNKELIQLLLSAGVNINAQDEARFNTPLMDLAKKYGELELLSSNEGWTALHWAVWFGFTENVQVLVDNKAKLNAMDGADHTPLMIAISSHRPDIVKKLLSAGADLEPRSIHDMTALEIAKKENHKEIINLLNKEKRARARRASKLSSACKKAFESTAQK